MNNGRVRATSQATQRANELPRARHTSVAAAALLFLLHAPMSVADQLLFSARQWGNVNLHIEQSAGRSIESVLASNPNFELLDRYPRDSRLRRLSRPVGRLDVRFGSGDFITCTASLIGSGKLLTNHHCVPGDGRYGPVTEASLLMGYYSETDTQDIKRYEVDVTPVEARQADDYSVLRVEGRPGGEWGTVRLLSSNPRPGETLLVVHHPGGHAKHVTRGRCRAAFPTPVRGQELLHKCDTLPGSSGAPIFADDSQGVIALHYAGSAAPGPDRYNYGMLMSGLRARSRQLGEATVREAPAAESEPQTLSGGFKVKPTQPSVDPRGDAEREGFKLVPSQPNPDAGSDAVRCSAGLAPKTVCRDRLRDGTGGPPMVVVRGGSFRMGDLHGSGRSEERPVHEVRVAPFALGRHEVTFEEYDAFARATGRELPNDRGYGRGNRPVISVSWKDAVAYAEWLSQQTGKPYRLPTEAEWEYAARAGTETKYWWGNEVGSGNANCAGCGSQWDVQQTAPVGSFKPNPWGLYDTVGNVYEWVQDCWHGSYEGAPTDGSAWLEGDGGNCGRRVLRGGSWGKSGPRNVRSADRTLKLAPDRRFGIVGFRVAQNLR